MAELQIITLTDAYINGMAYFNNTQGQRFFRPSGADLNPHRPTRNPHPSELLYAVADPLADIGREFLEFPAANRYMRVLDQYNLLLGQAKISVESIFPELREIARTVAVDLQQELRRNVPEILGILPNDPRLHGYLEMSPLEIGASLQREHHGVSRK